VAGAVQKALLNHRHKAKVVQQLKVVLKHHPKEVKVQVKVPAKAAVKQRLKKEVQLAAAGKQKSLYIESS
jgi:hypothetical protein